MITTYWEAEHLCPLIFKILCLCNGCRQFHVEDVIWIFLTYQWEKEQGLLDPGILPQTPNDIFYLTS